MTASTGEREGLSRQIERRSIDYVPQDEQHGKVWHQGPFWFLGNFQFFTITIGFIGPGLGLSLGWSILAGTLGILFGTLFMDFHAIQGAAAPHQLSRDTRIEPSEPRAEAPAHEIKDPKPDA